MAIAWLICKRKISKSWEYQRLSIFDDFSLFPYVPDSVIVTRTVYTNIFVCVGDCVTDWLTDWFECLFLYACLVLLSVYIFVSLTVTGCLLWCSLPFYLNVFICLFILQGPRLKLLYAMRGKADKVILEPSEFHRKITLTFKAQSIVLQCPGTLGTIGCILLKANVRNKSQGLYCL